jgi:predicted nucleotidyltransferase
MPTARVNVPEAEIRAFCVRNHICRLAFFGSVLRDDFGPASDVDVLVEFEPGQAPGLFGLAAMERELSGLLGGRAVDMRTPRDLSRYFREEVAAHAVVQYAAG